MALLITEARVCSSFSPVELEIVYILEVYIIILVFTITLVNILRQCVLKLVSH